MAKRSHPSFYCGHQLSATGWLALLFSTSPLLPQEKERHLSYRRLSPDGPRRQAKDIEFIPSRDLMQDVADRSLRVKCPLQEEYFTENISRRPRGNWQFAFSPPPVSNFSFFLLNLSFDRNRKKIYRFVRFFFLYLIKHLMIDIAISNNLLNKFV